MKKLTFLLTAALCFFFGSNAWAKLPQNYQKFKARYQTEGRTIEGAFKLHLEAIFCYIEPKTRKEASKMLRYSMHLSEPLEQSKKSGLFVRRMLDPEYNFVFRSFCTGTSPQNNYSMNPDNFRVNFAGSKQEEGYVRLFVKSSGADSAAHIWMQNYDGLWYTTNNSSLYVMVREPQERIDQRKNLHDADYDGKPYNTSSTNSNTNTTPSLQPIDINSLMPQTPVGAAVSSSQTQKSSNSNSYNNSYSNSNNNFIEQTVRKAVREIMPKTNTQYRRY